MTAKTPEERFYAVQIFVSGSDDVLNLSKYDELKTIGNVYIAPEDGKQKVRLGVYSTRELANSALDKVKAKGFTGAYAIEEKNDKAVSNNFTPAPKQKVVVMEAEPEKPLPKPKTTQATTVSKSPKPLPKLKVVQPAATTQPKVQTPLPKPKAVKTATTIKAPTAAALPKPKSYNTVVKPKDVTVVAPTKVVKKEVEDKTFKVKIAAMKKPEWFDDSKVANLCKVDQVVEGDLTLFIMDGFKTLQQAKDMKAKVKAAGYKDAKVVVKDGTKFKVVD